MYFYVKSFKSFDRIAVNIIIYTVTYAFLKKKNYLAALGLSCGMLDLSLWCVAFSSMALGL